jgi:small subunit ribosomal protein S17
VKLRGRIFEGVVVKKLPKRVKIAFDRVVYDRKYERFEKRRSKMHARLPDCLKDEINVGDYIQISECRPISKMILLWL